MSKKDRKMEILTKQLEAEKKEKAEIGEQLKKLQAELEAMKSAQMPNPTPEKEVLNDAGEEFEVAPSASSTRRVRSMANLEESRFLSSVNQLSISSITVPECKPAEGDDEIHRNTFEMWRDLLIDCMALAGIEDEFTKFTVFKVKAGPRLLTVFRNTKSDVDAPDATTEPFSNALHRLRQYFGSGSDIMFQRRKLALMEQKTEESDLAFVTRVGETAQLCDFDKAKEFEEIAKAVAEHARCKEVRVTALKMVTRNGSFTDLVDKVREIQAIRMNEEYFAVKHGPEATTSKPALVAPLRAEHSKQWIPRRNFSQRADNRYVPYSRGYARNNQRVGRQSGWRMNNSDSARSNAGAHNDQRQSGRCWRCYSYFHLPSECGAANLVCRKCGVLGHIQRACQPSIKENMKRVPTKDISEIEVNYAQAEANDEEATSKQEKVNVSEEHDEVEGDRHVIATIGTCVEECIVTASVAGMRCDFLVDSGAEVNTFIEQSFHILKNDNRYSGSLYSIREGSDVPLKAYASKGEIAAATADGELCNTHTNQLSTPLLYLVR
nr:uncharacterized protein LOC109423460 [Aedes albopictus]